MGLKHKFFTGDFQVGKSTAVKQILQSFQSCEIKGVFTTFQADSNNSKTVFLNGYEVGKLQNHKVLYAYPEIFDTVGVAAITPDKSTKIIVIDEIGLLEEKAEKYSIAVINLLNQTDIPVVGVLRKTSHIKLAETIRNHKNVDLIQLDK